MFNSCRRQWHHSSCGEQLFGIFSLGWSAQIVTMDMSSSLAPQKHFTSWLDLDGVQMGLPQYIHTQGWVGFF